MKVLILGGDGFIGSHLRNAHLMLDDEVTILDKNLYRSTKSGSYKVVEMDLSRNKAADHLYGLCKLNSYDFIYNCVAVATPAFYVKHPIETFELDFEINKSLVDLIDKLGIPFIHFSTSEVYGKTWTEPYTEDSNYVIGPAHKQRWIYATSKILLDQYIQASNMNCCILRPFNFCGADMDWLEFIPENRDKKWIPRLPACFMNNLIQRIPLNVVLPGTQRRCYTYIDDAVQGILSIIDNWDKCQGEIFNIGNNNNETSIIDMANLFIRTYNDITGDDPITIKYIDGIELYGAGYEDSERRLFSDDKIYNTTGWKPKISLDATVRLTIENSLQIYSNYINKYRNY